MPSYCRRRDSGALLHISKDREVNNCTTQALEFLPEEARAYILEKGAWEQKDGHKRISTRPDGACSFARENGDEMLGCMFEEAWEAWKSLYWMSSGNESMLFSSFSFSSREA